jgi:hypothetical protein
VFPEGGDAPDLLTNETVMQAAQHSKTGKS